MKRSSILAIVAIVLLVVYTSVISGTFLVLAILLILALAYVVVFNEFFRRRHPGDDFRPYDRTVDDLTAEYGQPDDVILVNATRANEALGVILAYKDFFIVEGRRIEKADISGVTFNNSGTPYTPAEYQVIIATGPSQGDYLHVNAGYDAAWTKDVVEQIKRNL